MKIIKKSNLNIDEIVKELRDGKVIVYPTETTYGLGCDATNKEAVEKVFKIKRRQDNKPVLVVAPFVNMMMNYISWNSKLDEIAMKHWPGPVTVVADLKSHAKLPSGVVGEDNTLAFRITKHPIVFEISERLGKPLVSTSANIASLESPYDIESVLQMYQDVDVQPDIIIDAGELPQRSPSTIVRVTEDSISVLRQGEVVI